jgi:hypothetical protein
MNFSDKPPLWLLQKEDTPFLCLSFLFSILLHGLLFIVLAATRIFQPFTGFSGEFELIWLSPSSRESAMMAHEKKAPVVHSTAAPTVATRANRTGSLKYSIAEQKAAPPTSARTTPVVKPPSPRVVDVPEKLESESFTAEADAEMVVSRFGGKVVEIVGKDIEIPVYRVFSAAQKSPGQRAMVQYLPETENHAPEEAMPVRRIEPPVQKSLDIHAGNDLTDRIERVVTMPTAVVTPTNKSIAATVPPDTKVKTVAVKRSEQPSAMPEPVVAPPSRISTFATEPVNEKAGNDAMKRSEIVVLPPAAERVANVEKIVVARVQPVLLRQSSSVRTTVSLHRSSARETEIIPPEHRPLAATVPVPSPKNPSETDRPATRSALRETVRPKRPEVSAPPPGEVPVERQGQVMPKAEPAIVKSSPVVQPDPKPMLGKPLPSQPEKPRAIFMPPLAGDLKIVITGKEDIKVEAVFREFRKARRGRPVTRGEARNTRSIPLKRARTHLNVHEAVVEIAEEGVYDLLIRSADGKPVTASFVLKVHESGKGAVTKNLGKRTLPDGALLARILMPEGLLWDDESYFTGTMEDSDSITRFHTETGLVWREFR